MLLYFKKAVPASFNGSLELAGYTGEATYYEPEGAALSQLEVLSTDPLTAGSITLTASKNGAALGSVTLQTGTPRAAVALAASLAPGDRLTVTATSTSTLAPTTADVLAVLAP